MKKLAALAGLTLLTSIFATSIVRAQKPFEGTLHWTLVSSKLGDDEKHEMLINVKGTKCEADLDLGMMGKAKMYPDLANHKMKVYLVAQHAGIEQPLGGGGGATDADVDIKPLGKRMTIGGHEAEAYQMTSASGDKVVWFASDFPSDIKDGFVGGMRNFAKGSTKERAALEKYFAKGLLPVKIETTEAGEVTNSFEFASLEMHSIDDAVFVLPSGVTFQHAPAGMDGN